MRKRWMAIILVIAMVASYLPVGVSAEEAQVRHPHNEAGYTGHVCQADLCHAAWTAWSSTTTLPTANGHYYLTGNVTVNGRQDIPAGADVTICLNGYTVTETNNTNYQNLSYVNGKLTIADCGAYTSASGEYISGAITSCKNADGGCFNVRAGGTLILEGGKLTGNTATGGGGAISVAGSSTAALYIYGGEISGNVAANGGGVMLNTASKCYIYGGKITGNSSTSTTGGGGGIYLNNKCQLQLHGGEVSGNTVKKDAPGIFVAGAASTVTVSGEPVADNMQFVSADNVGLQIGGEKGLTGNASIFYVTKSGKTDLTVLAGTNQENWESGWLICNGKVVSREDGSFQLGHFHDTTEYTAVTDLPAESGKYCLTRDVELNAEWVVNGDVELCLNGHTIAQKGANARVITVNSGHSLTIISCTDGGTVTGGSTGAMGGGIYVNGGTLHLEGITVSGNRATGSGGGIAATNSGKVTLTNVTLTGNESSTQGGGLFANKQSQVAITGGTVSQNTGKADGGGMYLHTVTATIQNLTVSGNESKASSGGIGFGGPSQGTLDNITITDNIAPSGAGLLVQGTSVVSVSGSKLTGNCAARGGGIYLNENASLTVKDTAITGNEGRLNGGGIFTHAKAKNLTLQRNTQIKENTINNLFLDGTVLVSFDELGEKALIGITTAENAVRAISTKTTADPTKKLKSDTASRKITYAEGIVYVDAGGEHVHCVCDGTAAGCDHSSVSWAAWEKTDSLPASGNYYLTGSVQLTKEASITGNLNLCLNGYTVTAAKDTRILSTPKNAEITVSITDCSALVNGEGNYQAGKLTGGSEKTGTGGGGIYIRAGGTLKLYEGLITGNTSTTAGGGILLAAGAKFYMYGGELSKNTAMSGSAYKDGGAIYMVSNAETQLLGGTIRENKALNGGAVYAGNPAKVTIDGSTICENTATTRGGAVYAAKNATVTITDGEISGNSAGQDGGAICASTASHLTLTGGKISSNTSNAQGGGIYAGEEATVLISGGKLSKNKAVKDGGGLYAYGSVVTVSGGVIQRNSSPASAGGIGISKNGRAVISGGKIIENDSPNGGGLLVQGNATLEMTGGEVAQNNAASVGGGIYVNTGSVLTITDGSIMGNTVGNSGGGIYTAPKGIVKMTGGTISSNKAQSAGGGIYSSTESELTLSGGLITENTAVKQSGGGIGAGKSSLVTLSGVKISNNSSGAQGGGVYTNEEVELVISGGEISGNNSTKDGGGVYAFGSTVTISGGEIRNNTSKVAAGGVGISKNGKAIMRSGKLTGNSSPNGGALLIQGSAAFELIGGEIVNNTASIVGGGIHVNSNSTLTMKGGTISNNAANNSGAGIYAAPKSVLNMNGGTIANNKAQSAGGGIYASTDSRLTLSGGVINGNIAVKQSGGVCASKATVIMHSGLELSNNQAHSNGGGLYITEGKLTADGTKFINNFGRTGGGAMYTFWSEAELKNVTVTGNKSDSAGGGVAFSKLSTFILQGGVIEENTAKMAGGLLIQNWSEGTVTDLIVRNNEATGNWGGGIAQFSSTVVAYKNCEINDNKAVGNGGGMYIQSTNSSHKPMAFATLTDLKIHGNHSDADGGGLCVINQVDYTLADSQIFDNSANKRGGGLVHCGGAEGVLTNLMVTDNQSKQQGGGLWIADNTLLNNVTVTGNTSEEGAAVCYEDSGYDGESYVLGVYKMSGNICIYDNNCPMGDLYIGEKTTISTTAEGFGKDTLIHVQLHSGVLTNTLLGAYDYEGGDLQYTVTYGDRSLREPEYDSNAASVWADAARQDQAAANIWLYTAVGAFALAAIAAVVLLIAKKKKSASGSQK